MPKLYWKYRAYDENKEVSEGLYEGGRNHFEVILTLRQQDDLQVIDLVKISQQQFAAEKRAERLRQKIDIPEIPHRTNEPSFIQIRRGWFWFASILMLILLGIAYALLQ